MSEKSALTVCLSGVFSPDEGDPKRDYTATIELNVSPDTPKGFVEFFTQVSDLSALDKTHNPYQENLPSWEGRVYDDICAVIAVYPEYFSYKVVRSSIDVDEVKLEELYANIFHWYGVGAETAGLIGDE